MKKAKAFSPCHITGFFQIFDQSSDPLRIGSRGAGVSLKRGVETTVQIEEDDEVSLSIKINGVLQHSAEVSEYVTNTMLSRLVEPTSLVVTVNHSIDVPVGAGFGTSGAAALSLSLALNDALDLGMSRTQAAQVAHISEVKCKTGLGTVIAETFGGVEIRVKAGAPEIGEVRQVPVSKNIVVACLAFGSLSTKDSLANPEMRERINKFGGGLVDKLKEQPEIDNFMKLSRQFAEHMGLIHRNVRRVLDAADNVGFTCSMPMFGDSVFTLVERDSLEDLLKLFREQSPTATIITSEIDLAGARML